MYQATNGQTYAHSQTKCCVVSACGLLVQLPTMLVYLTAPVDAATLSRVKLSSEQTFKPWYLPHNDDAHALVEALAAELGLSLKGSTRAKHKTILASFLYQRWAYQS